MTAATLPDLPKGTEFEDYAAAVLQSARYFVERDLTERDVIELLQLDVIATDYDESPPLMRLIEAKSGDWGFSDIFKIKGWMTHLGINRASLVTRKDRDHPEHYERLAKKLDVDLVHVANLDEYNKSFETLLKGHKLESNDVSTWRFIYWTERSLLDRVRAQKSGDKSSERFAAILDHAFRINSGIFFAGSIAERVESLYDTYGEYRSLAAKCATEMDGGGFLGDNIPKAVFESTFYKCELNEVQTACMLEHKARLALLKAAVDYVSYRQTGEKVEQWIKLTFQGKDTWVPWVTFPKTFEAALQAIESEPHFKRYPVFWQWFLGPFGGFILLDYEEEEYQLLADKSGVPVDAVPDAFDAYEKLFPLNNGWFRESDKSRVKQLLLTPIPTRGIGANYRRLMFTKDGKYDSLELSGEYTSKDLAKWVKAVVKLLNG